MKNLLLAFIIFTVLQVQAQNKAVGLIDSLMRTAHARGIYNGNILIAKHDKILFEKSYGFADGSKTKPLKPNLAFDIGSISKEFNGVAIMLLTEQGKLSLDDALSKYYPEFPQWAKGVRLRHLLNYTSGIPVLGPAKDGNDSLIYQSLIGLKSLSGEPGTVYIYNHINVVLQRRIIEKVSGQAYADFITKNLLRPAGMHNTRIDLPVNAPGMARAFDESGREVSYAQDGNKGWVRLPVRDLYRWAKALHSGRLISMTSLKTLSENFPGGESSLGTAVFEGDKLSWHQHQGSNSNYEAAYYCRLKDGISIVMMTSNQQMKVWPLKSSILNILDNQPFDIPKKSLYLSIRDSLLADIDGGIGYYQHLKATAQDRYDFSFELGDLISAGKYLQRRNKLDEAIKLFSLALMQPGKPEDLSYGYELLGDCYRSKGQASEALVNYRKAASLYPQNKNATSRINELSN